MKRYRKICPISNLIKVNLDKCATVYSEMKKDNPTRRFTFVCVTFEVNVSTTLGLKLLSKHIIKRVITGNLCFWSTVLIVFVSYSYHMFQNSDYTEAEKLKGKFLSNC